MLDFEDQRLLVELSASGPCSMNKSPKKNWVEKSGGLPNYICHIAKAVARGGHGTGGAIAIAVGTVKRWAAGGGNVDAKTRAKAAAAVAQWEALKARNAGRHVVKASHITRDFVMLSASADDSGDYRVAVVPQAFNEMMEHYRNLNDGMSEMGEAQIGPPSRWAWIKEQWNNFLIVQSDDGDSDGPDLFRVPFTVENDGDVDFGAWTEVQVQYVDAPDDSDDDDDLTDQELQYVNEALQAYPGKLSFYDRPTPSPVTSW